MNENRVKDTDPEGEQSSLEHEKIKLEREKLAVERYKARLTALSIAIPVVLAIIGFGYSSYVENKRNEAEFRLKAFEVLLSDPNAQIGNKAAMINDLFPSFHIAPDVVSRLTNYGNGQYWGQQSIDMFHMYANSSRTKAQLVTTYNQLFGNNPVVGNMVSVQGVDPEVSPNNGIHPTPKQPASSAR